jgi:hypothetical protein
MIRPDLTSKIRKLAQRLLWFEAAHTSGSPIPTVLRVSEKLRSALSILMGSSGFRSLLARSLTMAKALEPRLAAVHVDPDGSLQGWSTIGNENRDAQADVIVVAQLLGLLATFIGEGLMQSLILDAWPDFNFEDNLEKRKCPHKTE